MRIAQLAPTYERVPPATYGGTELVVHLLTEGLVRRGHDVTLFATGDSVTSAVLRSLTPEPVRYGSGGTVRHPEHIQLANAQACFREAAAGGFDLVHNHAGIEGLVLAATSETPVLTTNHNAYASETSSVWESYPWRHVSLSAASAQTFPERGALLPVHNGIDVETFPFNERPTGELLFLGRLSPDKGPDRAIAAARRAGRTIVLAGKIDAADRPFFDLEVAPMLDSDQARFVGEVDGNRKRELLSRAAALLFPIEWDEPFGLVLVEALACGTPVIAFDRSGVREIVEHGETGFVVDDVEAMAEAIRHLDALSRRRCRSAAEERFDAGRMVDAYEARYLETIAAGRLPAEASPFVRW
jgi:glycosyltransferase involved in cell wall biosynthesis